MKTDTKLPVPTYSPNPAHAYHAPFLKQDRGQELLNLMWISLPHDKRGLTDLRDAELVKALVRTPSTLPTPHAKLGQTKSPAAKKQG